MAISLLSNISSINAERHLEKNRQVYEKAIEKLASGSRLNRAGDDAAGSAISYSLEARIRSIHQAERNAQDALSLFQVAGGATNEISNILVRLRELAMQASSDTVGDREREMLEVEAVQLKEEVDRIAESTKYLDTNLLNGAGKDFTFQIGIEDGEVNRLNYSASDIDVRASTLGIDDVSIRDRDSALDALSAIDEAVIRLHVPRAQMGAMQTRLQSTLGFLADYGENLTAANSRIRDADLAHEASEVVRGQMLQKAGMAVLAQANMMPTLAMRLLE